VEGFRPEAGGEEEAEEGEVAPLAAFTPPPFSLFSRRGFTLREYVKEVARRLVEERGEVSLEDLVLVLKRAAERDKRVRQGLTRRIVLLALKELAAEGYRVRLRLR